MPEIQVLSLQLKALELHRDVLRCIDGAIPFPIIFELAFDGRVRVIAAYKRPSEADASRWVLSDYFATEWLPADCQRANMPVALYIGGLYEKLLSGLIPLPARPEESLTDLVARMEQVAGKRRDLDKAAALLTKEGQFNRKVEINAKLRRLNDEILGLIINS